MQCKVCEHPERDAVDRALARGQRSLRGLSEQYGLTRSALHRHKANHLPATLRSRAVMEQEAGRAAMRADDLLDGLAALRQRLEAALEGAAGAKDISALAREVRETIRLVAELEGRLRPQGSVEVNVAIIERERREMDALMSAVVAVLGEFPDARRAVLEVLGRGAERVHTALALAAQAPASRDEPLPAEQRPPMASDG